MYPNQSQRDSNETLQNIPVDASQRKQLSMTGAT